MSTSQISYCALRYTVYGRDGGEQCASVLRFNGQSKEPVTGHYLLGNGYRGFNSALMRFNSPDSFSPFGDGGLNAYCYCGGDPVNKIDPSGHAGIELNSFVNGGLFTKRWGLRTLASMVAGQSSKAPALKTLSVKKALSEIDASLQGRMKKVERYESWQPRDVQRLENASFWLYGRANRFELAKKNFDAGNFPLEAQAAYETWHEILAVKKWVDSKLIKIRPMVERKKLFEVLPFPPENMPRIRRGG